MKCEGGRSMGMKELRRSRRNERWRRCRKRKDRRSKRIISDIFRCYSYTIIRGRINLCALKLQFVKIVH